MSFGNSVVTCFVRSGDVIGIITMTHVYNILISEP